MKTFKRTARRGRVVQACGAFSTALLAVGTLAWAISPGTAHPVAGVAAESVGGETMVDARGDIQPVVDQGRRAVVVRNGDVRLYTGAAADRFAAANEAMPSPQSADLDASGVRVRYGRPDIAIRIPTEPKPSAGEASILVLVEPRTPAGAIMEDDCGGGRLFPAMASPQPVIGTACSVQEQGAAPAWHPPRMLTLREIEVLAERAALNGLRNSRDRIATLPDFSAAERGKVLAAVDQSIQNLERRTGSAAL